MKECLGEASAKGCLRKLPGKRREFERVETHDMKRFLLTRRGYCGAREDREGVYYTLAWGRLGPAGDEEDSAR